MRTRLETIRREIRRRPLFEAVRLDIIERDVEAPLPRLKPIPGAELRRIGPGHSEGWRELLPRKRWKIATLGLKEGHEMIFLMYQGDLAARILYTLSSWRDPRSRISYRLAPGEAYAYGMEAYPEYRHLGAAATVVAAMMADLRAAGAQRLYGAVDQPNRESQVLMRMMFGFTQVQSVKRMLVLRRIGWQAPGTDEPSFGPVSKAGRHSDALAASGAR
jgi:hypothetical protein